MTVSSPGGTCSGSLLRNEWVITAAHCVDSPDPANPGQFIVVAENSVTLTANWKKGAQVRQSMRVISFRPMDVAIIRVTELFNGREGGYNRDIFQGDLVPVNVAAYGRGITQFASFVGAMAVPVPSSGDGLYRTANFSTSSQTGQGGDHLVWFPTASGSTIAGGDSGGPSFIKTVAGDLLFGVHARSNSPCLAGQSCPQADQWTWAAATTRFADAPIAPLRDEINGYLGAFVPPPTGFIGTFSQSPPNYQPLWIYGIGRNGELTWYRKDSSAAAWQGPKQVGIGWNGFADVIPAGGNSFYALTNGGKLVWYRHDGFNDGSSAWSPPVEVGSGWSFSRIFSGGQGIVYAIANDGTLVWYKNNGADHGVRSWQPAKVVGNGWSNFKDVFSTGQGAIYAARNDGSLLLYWHDGYLTGEPKWQEPRFVGAGWNSFKEIVPSSDGVILGILPNGKLLWFKDSRPAAPSGLGRIKLPQQAPNPTEAMLSICDRARSARARNSPAAPGLESQCRVFEASFVPIDAQTLAGLAAKGPAIAAADPLFTELRNRQSGPSRDGFDIGMAAAEGQTAPGPGKQRIHDSLAPDQRPGFDVAVAFSLERNRNVDLATRGTAIATADPLVAATRAEDPDIFYWLGFDIATGLYGSANLGALGYTATGPGAYKIRDALSAAGQRGFNAAVYFNLGVTANPTLANGDGPVEIGSGWQDFGKVIALIPDPAPVVR